MRSHPDSKSKLRDQELASLFKNFQPSAAVGVLGSTELDGERLLENVDARAIVGVDDLGSTSVKATAIKNGPASVEFAEPMPTKLDWW